MEVYNDTSKKENGTRGRCCRCHQGGHHLSGYGWTPTSAVGMVDEREEDAHRRHQGLDLAKANRTWRWLVGDSKRRQAPLRTGCEARARANKWIQFPELRIRRRGGEQRRLGSLRRRRGCRLPSRSKDMAEENDPAVAILVGASGCAGVWLRRRPSEDRMGAVLWGSSVRRLPSRAGRLGGSPI
jgi:hypothetical protein